MTTYYMRADGTAASKAEATGPSSSATAMSVTIFNSQDFVDGDIILMSSQGGDYSDRVVPHNHGTDQANKITLSNVSGESPKIDGGSVISNCILTNKNNWIIEGIELTGATSTTVSIITTADGVELNDLYLHDTYGGININTTAGSTVIRNPKIHDLTHPTNAVGITASSSDIDVTVENPNIYNVDLGLSSSGGTITCSGGTIHDVAYSLIATGSAIVTLSDDMDIYNCSGDGVVANETSTVTVNGNRIHDCGNDTDSSSGDGVTAHGSATLNVYNNMLYRNKKSGVAVAEQSTGRIINNKIYDNYDESNDISWTTSYGVGIAIQSLGEWEVKNNVTKNNGQEVAIIGDGGNVDSDGNCFDDSRGEAEPFYFNGVGYSSFAAYQVASGQDVNSINSDPLFFAPGSADFRIQPNSPTVAAGIASVIPSQGRVKYNLVYDSATDKYALPSAPELITALGLDSTWFDISGVGLNYSLAEWYAFNGFQVFGSTSKEQILVYSVIQTDPALTKILSYMGNV